MTLPALRSAEAARAFRLTAAAHDVAAKTKKRLDEQ